MADEQPTPDVTHPHTLRMEWGTELQGGPPVVVSLHDLRRLMNHAMDTAGGALREEYDRCVLAVDACKGVDEYTYHKSPEHSVESKATRWAVTIEPTRYVAGMRRTALGKWDISEGATPEEALDQIRKVEAARTAKQQAEALRRQAHQLVEEARRLDADAGTDDMEPK